MNKTGPKPRPPEERFWAHVRSGSSDECWEWQGSRLDAGYGQFGLTPRRPALAHRYAWQLANGPIPDGMHVLHRCDNPPCCNPEHLFLGTNADNIADKVAKGRTPSGDLHWSRRMPEKICRRPMTEETRKNLSASKRGSISWNKGLRAETDIRIVRPARAPIATANKDLIITSYNLGESVESIRVALGCSWNAIAGLLRSENIAIRSISEQKAIRDRRNNDR